MILFKVTVYFGRQPVAITPGGKSDDTSESEEGKSLRDKLNVNKT